MTAPRKEDTTLEAETERHNAARPDRGQAEDGKTGGEMNEGAPGSSQFVSSGGDGVNARSGPAAGGGTERDAPGVWTDKKADDAK